MVKMLTLPGRYLGAIIVDDIIIFSDNKALLLFSLPDGGEGWDYFNPENGELIEAKNGL